MINLNSLKLHKSSYRYIFSSKFNLSFGQRDGTCKHGVVDETNDITNYHQAYDMLKLDRTLPKQKREVAYLTLH